MSEKFVEIKKIKNNFYIYIFQIFLIIKYKILIIIYKYYKIIYIYFVKYNK